MTKRYTVEEIALILNWADYCVIKNLNYYETIVKEFEKKSKRKNVKAKNIRRLLHTLGHKYYAKNHGTTEDLRDNGTKYMDLTKLPEDLKQTMNEQRLGWGIGTLDERDKVEPLMTLDKDLAQEAQAPSGSSPTTLPADESINFNEILHDPRGNNEAVSGLLRHEKRGLPITNLASTKKRLCPISSEPDEQVTSPRTDSSSNGDQTPGAKSPNASPLNSRGLTPATPGLEITGHEASADARWGEMYGLLDWLLQEHVKAQKGKGLPDSVLERLTSLRRMIGENPGEAAAELAQSLVEVEETNTKYHKILNDLVGNQAWSASLTFPLSPPATVLAKEWEAIHSQLQFAVRRQCSQEPLPPFIAKYLAGSLEEIFDSGTFPPEDLRKWIGDLELPLTNRHAAQNIMSAVHLTLIFDSMHDLRYWQVAAKLLDVVRQVGSAAVARKLDSIGTKRWFEDPAFDKTVLRPQIDRIAALLSDCWEASRPGDQLPANIARPQGWLRRAMKLKLDLMVSLEEYKIHYCQPGMDFDPSWMQAEDAHGNAIAMASEAHCTHKVRVCLFPALLQQPFNEHSTTFAKDKRFFLTRDERLMFDPAIATTLAKAVVLVRHRDD